MKKLIFDGEQITDSDSLNITLKRVLNFPDYYGYNLDALHDCLTDVCEEVMIYVKNTEALREKLGDYADSFVKVLQDSASENKWLHVTIL